MSGKILSEENRIRIFPPDLAVHYIVELQETDHIRVWVVIDGQRFTTDHIPLEVIPYMEILINRRKARKRKRFQLEKVGIGF